MKKLKKIDLYYAGDYYTSTNQFRTCKEAVSKTLERLENRSHAIGGLGLVESQILKNPHLLKASFDKDAKNGQ